MRGSISQIFAKIAHISCRTLLQRSLHVSLSGLGYQLIILILQGSSFATGLDVQERRQTVQYISTGSKSVDAILGGTQVSR